MTNARVSGRSQWKDAENPAQASMTEFPPSFYQASAPHLPRMGRLGSDVPPAQLPPQPIVLKFQKCCEMAVKQSHDEVKLDKLQLDKLQ